MSQQEDKNETIRKLTEEMRVMLSFIASKGLLPELKKFKEAVEKAEREKGKPKIAG